MKTPCDICDANWPKPDSWITTFSESSVYLYSDQFFPGYCVLILQRHATELFELTSLERNRLMEEVSMVAHALTEVFGAHKINYALLGNYTPHIHWHIVPRLADDPIPKESTFNYSHTPKTLSADETAERIRLIQKQLSLTIL